MERKREYHLIRTSIRSDMLAGAIEIKDGQHLVNSEQPDDVVKIIRESMTKRDEEYKKKRSMIPEIALNGDKNAIRDQQYKLILNLDMDHVYGYDAANHVPFQLIDKKSKL